MFSKKIRRRNYRLEFAQSFSKWIGTKYSLLTSSGCEALEIIIRYKHLDKNGILLVPVFTAQVVQKTLQRLRVNYELVDVDPLTATLDFEDFKAKLEKNKEVRAVLCTHLLGHICDPQIIEYAKQHNIFVIEDCAHAHGASLNNIMAGSMGDVSFFSFGPAKLINTFGGGILNTNNNELILFAEKMISTLKEPSLFFILKKLIFSHVETLFSLPLFNLTFRYLFKNEKTLQNFRAIFLKLNRENKNRKRYSQLQAYIGLKQLKDINQTIAKRNFSMERILSQITQNIQLIRKKKEAVPYNFIIRVQSPLKLKKYLWSKKIDSGIQNSIMWPLGDPQEFKGLKQVLDSFIQLPLHHRLNKKDEEKIVEALSQYQA
ncbi:MAG: DegT/DnrJ/EryC1/StrS family aminotransferase [Bdellovibrionales bacterium]|nr:DegT/DnrJ/EryC1/StrS family aminotransferase [Bdellovibrionales bacterium]